VWRIVIFLAALMALVSVWKGKDIKDSIMEKVTDGIIQESPESLAAEAGVSLEIYSLARAMQSEESSEAGRIAVGWAVKNYSKGSTIVKAVTAGRRKDKKTGKTTIYASDGHYGTGNCTPGRYCNSFRAPTSATLALAARVYSGEIPDPTGGAKQFDAPKAQDKLVAAGAKGYNLSSDELYAKRVKAGKEAVYVPGVPNTRFWRKAT
jgi:hypothetical protein